MIQLAVPSFASVGFGVSFCGIRKWPSLRIRNPMLPVKQCSALPRLHSSVNVGRDDSSMLSLETLIA
jgi:hypothetical protein